MTSRKAAQGLLQLHARHSSRGHHKDVLWALLYLDSPVHRAPRGTQPNWAGHCTQEDFQEEYLPFHPNIHTYCCSSCIFWCYNKHISKHHQTLILCHPTCISSPWGYVQLVYTYLEIYLNTGKYTIIKVNVILVALIFPFSTLHIVTFSDVDYWDHNRGMFIT